MVRKNTIEKCRNPKVRGVTYVTNLCNQHWTGFKNLEWLQHVDAQWYHFQPLFFGFLGGFISAPWLGNSWNSMVEFPTSNVGLPEGTLHKALTRSP